MYIIIEHHNSYGNYYEVKTLDSSNQVSNNSVVQIKSFITRVDDKPMIMIYNSKMQPIEEAIRFINFGMIDDSLNYTRQTVTALKLLYSYLELYNISLKNMKKKEAKAFIDFIKGISMDGFLYETNLNTIRQNATINSYLKSLRKFVDYLDYDKHILLSKSSKLKRIVTTESDGEIKISTYDINIKPTTNNNIVPAYLSIDDYQKILLAIELKADKYSLRDRVICRLMYEHGLRIGECLGLTLEDIMYKEKKDFEVEYWIELRNRVSDTNEQKCKTCMHVKTEASYKDNDYRRLGYGYHKIMISSDLALELLDYVNDEHNSSNEKFLQRYKQYSKACTVPYGNPNIKTNYYVFLNSLGRPLSQNLWGKRLREVFKSVGLKLDEGIRKNNLSHRFRHGYAMALTNIYHMDDFDVKTLMRHKHLSTTSIYHNPTPEDIQKLQEKLIYRFKNYLLDESEDI